MKRNGANLTEGKPVKLILQFAIPVFLGNLFQLFYGLIDTKIVGSTLGEGALAAVGSVSILYNLLTGFFNGLTLGFSVVTARYFGAGDNEKLKKSVAGTILLGFITAAILVTGVFIFLRPLLAVMHVPAEQKEMAYTYISILVLGMFVTLAYNMCANVLRAIGDSLTPLIFLILAAVLNVILDYVCILAFSMGVGGAAVATVISQVVSVVLCVIHIKKHFPILQVERRHFKLKKTEVRTMLSGGLSMGMMSSLVNLGTLILQTGINTLGTSVIVAHTAARKVFEIWGLPVTVLGSTMATYSGQNYGAGKYDRITSGLKAALLLGCGWAVMVMIMAYTIATYLVGFIASTDSAEILYWGTTYLRVDMLFEMVCVWIVILRNTMQGVGDYRTPIFFKLSSNGFINKLQPRFEAICERLQEIDNETQKKLWGEVVLKDSEDEDIDFSFRDTSENVFQEALKTYCDNNKSRREYEKRMGMITDEERLRVKEFIEQLEAQRKKPQ